MWVIGSQVMSQYKVINKSNNFWRKSLNFFTVLSYNYSCIIYFPLFYVLHLKLWPLITVLTQLGLLYNHNPCSVITFICVIFHKISLLNLWHLKFVIDIGKSWRWDGENNDYVYFMVNCVTQMSGVISLIPDYPLKNQMMKT